MRYCPHQYRSKSIKDNMLSSSSSSSSSSAPSHNRQDIRSSYSSTKTTDETYKDASILSPDIKSDSKLRFGRIVDDGTAAKESSYESFTSHTNVISLEKAIQCDESGTLLSLKALVQLACSCWRWSFEAIDSETINTKHENRTTMSSTSTSSKQLALKATTSNTSLGMEGSRSRSADDVWTSSDLLARSLIISSSLECVGHVAIVMGNGFQPLLQQVGTVQSLGILLNCFYIYIACCLQYLDTSRCHNYIILYYHHAVLILKDLNPFLYFRYSSSW